MYLICMVGHKSTYETVRQIADEYFDDVEILHVELTSDDHPEEAAASLHQVMPRCSGIMYEDYDPYLLLSKQLEHTAPHCYFSTHPTDLLNYVLHGMVKYNLQLTNISQDVCPQQQAVKAFRLVGIDTGSFTLQTIEESVNLPNFVKTVLAQHIRNVQAGAQLCISNVPAVHDALIERGIPSVLTRPNDEIIVHHIRHLILGYNLMNNHDRQFAVLTIRLFFKEKNRFYAGLRLREIDEYTAAERILIVFADHVCGMIYRESKNEFRILCESDLLQSATKNFLDLLPVDKIIQDTAFEAIMGVGIGSTINEATKRSLTALGYCEQRRGSNTHILVEDNSLIGPIVPRRSEHIPDASTDQKMVEIARETGVSFSTLHTIYQHSLLRSGALFTTNELAEILNTTPRTANRLIEKLIDKGCATIQGNTLSPKKGRPSRLIRFSFTK